jgi:hypothetical protein
VPDPGAYYYLPNARFPEQRAEMARLESQGVCLFCTDEPGLGGPIVHRTSHWHIRRNKFPYGGTRIHLLLIPDSHVEDMAELSVAQEGDFWTAVRWARSRFDLTFYGLGPGAAILPTRAARSDTSTSICLSGTSTIPTVPDFTLGARLILTLKASGGLGCRTWPAQIPAGANEVLGRCCIKRSHDHRTGRSLVDVYSTAAGWAIMPALRAPGVRSAGEFTVS